MKRMLFLFVMLLLFLLTPIIPTTIGGGTLI